MEENKQHKTALPETEPIPSAQAPEAELAVVVFQQGPDQLALAGMSGRFE